MAMKDMIYMVNVREDLTGKTFGRWRVIKRADDYIESSGKHRAMWLCECLCDKHTIRNVKHSDLIHRRSTSCGCFRSNGYEDLNRIGSERLNNQGCTMKIVEYNSHSDIVVEFQDEYLTRIHTNYSNFMNGAVSNPYRKAVCGVGVTGNKYDITKEAIKEYRTWHNMLTRCFDDKYKEKHKTYYDAECCDEWLLFENFYEWAHSQSNFDTWINQKRSALDKDILFKNNKIYSPKTCCLVPYNVNNLFCKANNIRGELPIGVRKRRNKFTAECVDPLLGELKYLGMYNTQEEAFKAYKTYKEDLIKQVAQIEFEAGNITEECYNAMMKYEVEITD